MEGQDIFCTWIVMRPTVPMSTVNMSKFIVQEGGGGGGGYRDVFDDGVPDGHGLDPIMQGLECIDLLVGQSRVNGLPLRVVPEQQLGTILHTTGGVSMQVASACARLERLRKESATARGGLA